MSEIEQSSSGSGPDELSFPIPRKKDVGWLLVGGGVVGVLVTLMRAKRDLSDWILPLSLIGVGSGVLLKSRQSHIDAAQETIRTELDALDPIARAQVLKAVAGEQLGRLPRLGSSD